MFNDVELLQYLLIGIPWFFIALSGLYLGVALFYDKKKMFILRTLFFVFCAGAALILGQISLVGIALAGLVLGLLIGFLGRKWNVYPTEDYYLEQ